MASPEPLEIVEEPVIRELLAAGVIVIACGGGGVPVVADDAGSLAGVDAVIDKDLASSLLATAVDASTLAILTEVDRVYLNFGRADQKALEEVDVVTLKRLAAQGHFPDGSMGPKVQAAIGFIERGGARAIITSPDLLDEALHGRAGTHVTPSLELQATAS